MAEFYLPTDPEVEKTWSKKLWVEYRLADMFNNPKYQLSGKDADTNAWVILDELQKSTGDRIRVPMSYQISGRGVIGTEVMENKEQPIETATFDITIDDQVQGVRTEGVMVAQRVSFNTLEQGKARLKDWWKTRTAVSRTNHLAGFTAQTDLAYLGLNSVSAPSYIYRIGSGFNAGDDQTVGGSATNTLDVDTIDLLPTIAELLTPAIKPFVIDGAEYYGYVAHPDDITNLRKSNSEWYSTMQNALRGGLHDGNPIFTRALGKWRGVLIFSDAHVTQGVHSSTGDPVANTRRNYFFGAGALATAYGRQQRGTKEHMRYFSSTWDHGRKYYASAGMVWGCKKVRFTDPRDGVAKDNGVIVVTTYAAPLVTTADDNRGQEII